MPKPPIARLILAASWSLGVAAAASACGDDVFDPVESGQEHNDASSQDASESDDIFSRDIGVDTPDAADGDASVDANLPDVGDTSGLDDAADARADVSEPAPIVPGRVTIRRLNRLEYNNTVRDLFGTDLRPADSFPEDDLGYGFDNNGDVLSTSLLHAEFYLGAAEALVAESLSRPDDRTIELSLEAELIGSTVGAASGSAWNLWSNGEITTQVDFVRDGTYTIAIEAFGTVAGGVAPQMLVLLDGIVLADAFVVGDRTTPDRVEFDVVVEAGRRTLSVEFTNDFYDPDAGEDRNLYVDRLHVAGPSELPSPNPRRATWIFCEPAADGADRCTFEILDAIATRAWRRPATADEVERLRELAQSVLPADDIETGIEVAFVGALMSPHFLYRPELAPDLASPEPHALDDFALASRLSYFLWASMPDEQLLELAAAGALNNDLEIDRQVRRMLRDERAWGFVEGFAAQWLPIRALESASPDYAFFPDFDETLREAMRREMELFVWHILLEDRPIEEVLEADYTFVNERLAAHYQLDPASLADIDLGSAAIAALEGWYRVPHAAGRRGALGQAGLLTALSYPTRTSPVKRGKWIMTNLLCETPAPPPPGVESIDGNEELDGLPIRERMEIHREDPVCFSCHVIMDPLGFGLEHFDATGVWRNEDLGAPVDASGDLPDGRSFYGQAELAEVLADDPEYLDCFARQVSTWALGRGPTRYDAPIRAAILAEFEASPRRLSDMLSLVARSPAFTMRTPEVAE